MVVFFYTFQFPQESDCEPMSDEDVDKFAAENPVYRGEPVTAEFIAGLRECAAADREEQRRFRERPDLVAGYAWVNTQPNCIVCGESIVDRERRVRSARMRRQLKEDGLPGWADEPDVVPLDPWPDWVAAIALGGQPPRYRLLGGLCGECGREPDEINAARIAQNRQAKRARLNDEPGFEIGEPFPNDELIQGKGESEP